MTPRMFQKQVGTLLHSNRRNQYHTILPRSNSLDGNRLSANHHILSEPFKVQRRTASNVSQDGACGGVNGKTCKGSSFGGMLHTSVA